MVYKVRIILSSSCSKNNTEIQPENSPTCNFPWHICQLRQNQLCEDEPALEQLFSKIKKY